MLVKNLLQSMEFSLKHIADVLGVKVPAEDRCITRVLTDSRTLMPDAPSTIFFAIETAGNDGHRYVEELYNRGVRAFVVERPVDLPVDAVVLQVPSSVKALQALGADARQHFKGQVVAITGSVGKTALKESAAYLLKAAGHRVSRSPRSFNSQIGVPLTLCALDPDAELALIEAGVSCAGEMEVLERIIKPDVAVFTPMTAEHDEGFSSHQAKIEEKRILGRNAAVVIETPAGDLPPTEIHRRMAQRIAEATVGPVDVTGDVPEVHTRLQVDRGIGGCQLVVDRFTSDVAELEVALDFAHRRLVPSQRIVAVLGAVDGNHAAVAALLGLYNVQHVYAVGEQPWCEAVEEAGITLTRCSDVADLGHYVSPETFGGQMVLVKTPGIDGVAELLDARQHQTVLEVDLDAMRHNYNFFKGKVKPTTGVVCMVKAFGYGAGSYELAKTLQSQGAAYLAVAAHDEGVDLRRAGITMPIMVLNPRVDNYEAMFADRLEPEIYSLDILNRVITEGRNRSIKGFPVHIKLDTGMHRLGFIEDEIPAVAEVLKNQDIVVASSVFSHLCAADDPADDDYTRMQFEVFDRCCDTLQAALPAYRIKRHILNSTGIVRFPEHQYDMVRLGIGLYGIKTMNDGTMDALRPVSTLSTVIIAVREWPAGTTIGYNRRGVLKKHSRIATVPIGYADGLNRHLGYGNLQVSVGGVLCPTIGSICMDLMMIDISDAPRAAVGDRVEIFGPAVPAASLAATLNTIPYEILTSVSTRVKRVYYRD